MIGSWRGGGAVTGPADTTGRCIRLAFVLPEQAAMARPTGVGHALTAYRMPIEGRDEWIAAVERLA
jgi:hypothetical protein